MVRKGMIRGLEREKVNSDFMRLKNYTVIDNPTLKPSDGLNSRKAPDHRINGKIFDSYAPKMKVTVRSCSWAWGDMVNPLTEMFLDELSPWAQKQFRYIEGEFILKGIGHKVKEGQTRNILLNLADIESGGKLCEPEFAELLNQVKDLESVIAIYHKTNSPYRGYLKGGGEEWNNHFATDMEAMEWKHGQTGFHPLPDGANGDDEDKTSDSEDPDGQDPSSSGSGLSLSSISSASSGSGLSLCSILSGLGIFALGGLLVGMIGWLCGLFGSKKKKARSKSSKSAVAIYAWYMGPLISGKRLKPEDLATAHRDIKIMIPKLLPPGRKADDIDEILDDEYNDVIIDSQVYSFLEIFSPFYETIVLFIYSISRFVSTFITIATKNTSENNNIIGTHIALVLVSLLSQRFLQFIFLGMFCGPLKSIYYLCMISLAIRFVNTLTGFCAHASSAISYASGVLWEKTERNNVSSSKYTLPKRAVVILVGMVLVTLLGRLFVNISIASALFKVPAVLFTPFLYLVKIFKYFELLVKITGVLFAALFVVLLLFLVQMAWPSGVQFLHVYLDKGLQGFTVNNIADAFWKEIEIFIKLKSSSR